MKKAPRKPKSFLFNIKISDDDRETFAKLAKRFENGNVSAWVRLAARKYRPEKSVTR